MSTGSPEPPQSASEYLLDNRQLEAAARLDALGAVFDPWTRRHLDGIGLGAGWRCWEVGAGGPATAEWLAERVGATGRVLATDIEPKWTAGARSSIVEVRRHDVARDAPPAESFELVHARLVLVHVVDRERALRSMIDALAPGGWLVIEDADTELQPLVCPDDLGPEERLANALRAGFRKLMAERGVDLAYGRTLPRRLRRAGLVDVRADAFFPLACPETRVLERTTFDQIRERLLDAGLATPGDIERHLANVAAGRIDLATPPLISAWGRKPDATRHP